MLSVSILGSFALFFKRNPALKTKEDNVYFYSHLYFENTFILLYTVFKVCSETGRVAKNRNVDSMAYSFCISGNFKDI